MHTYFPQRIVCCAAEAPAILHALGALDRVVGVSSFTKRPPEAARLPRIGGFNTADVRRIMKLQPDLVITISDIQAEISAQLIAQGVPVLNLNPHTLSDIWQSILLVGAAVGRQLEAIKLVASMQADLEKIAALGDALSHRPRVYFEEWHDPPITGIGWVSDLIAVAGGHDVFYDLGNEPLAKNRITTFKDIAARQPEIIIASWCGKPADLESIRLRPQFQDVAAIQKNQMHEVNSDYLLQIGPSIIDGTWQLYDIIHAYTRVE